MLISPLRYWLCASWRHPCMLPRFWHRPIDWKCFCWSWTARHANRHHNNWGRFSFEDPRYTNNWGRFSPWRAIKFWWEQRKAGGLPADLRHAVGGFYCQNCSRVLLEKQGDICRACRKLLLASAQRTKGSQDAARS